MLWLKWKIQNKKMKTQISKIIFLTSLSCAVFSQYSGFLRTAKMYEMQKNWDAAISIYNDVLNKNPNNYQTIRSLKALYKKSQRYKEGINFLSLSNTPATSVKSNNLLAFNFPAINPAAVSALIL